MSGATGFIGSAVVRKLLEAGRPVRALVEPNASTKNLDALPPGAVERIPVDVCDFEGMKRALDGCSTFHHLAAVYKLWNPDPRAIYRVNVEGTTTSLLAAQAAGVGRVVYTSSIAAVGLRSDGRPSDETVEFNLWDIANEYLLTKMLSERIALRFAATLPVVVVNPAFPFGPGDLAPTPTGKIILSILRGEVPGLGPGGFCAVDVDDVAEAHVAAETRGRVGERYILGSHNVTFKEFCLAVAEIGGVPAPKLHIPAWVGRGVAMGMEAWSDYVTHEEPRATSKSISYLLRNVWFDTTKARTELGLASTPLRTSIERAVHWFRANGMV
ncbi:NAD-dependent epimerase/dehydratase [Minicystis rosea]|nr:NAD-dependent epimerase/dehydratase [Minicystis rosea]